jgi:hypothetical protein
MAMSDDDYFALVHRHLRVVLIPACARAVSSVKRGIRAWVAITTSQLWLLLLDGERAGE